MVPGLATSLLLMMLIRWSLVTLVYWSVCVRALYRTSYTEPVHCRDKPAGVSGELKQAGHNGANNTDSLNDEGNSVQYGTDASRSYTYYCGQRRMIFGSRNGRCGPSLGPQCASCVRFQDSSASEVESNQKCCVRIGAAVFGYNSMHDRDEGIDIKKTCLTIARGLIFGLPGLLIFITLVYAWVQHFMAQAPSNSTTSNITNVIGTNTTAGSTGVNSTAQHLPLMHASQYYHAQMWAFYALLAAAGYGLLKYIFPTLGRSILSILQLFYLKRCTRRTVRRRIWWRKLAAHQERRVLLNKCRALSPKPTEGMPPRPKPWLKSRALAVKLFGFNGSLPFALGYPLRQRVQSKGPVILLAYLVILAVFQLSYHMSPGMLRSTICIPGRECVVTRSVFDILDYEPTIADCSATHYVLHVGVFDQWPFGSQEGLLCFQPQAVTVTRLLSALSATVAALAVIYTSANIGVFSALLAAKRASQKLEEKGWRPFTTWCCAGSEKLQADANTKKAKDIQGRLLGKFMDTESTKETAQEHQEDPVHSAEENVDLEAGARNTPAENPLVHGSF